MVFVTSPDNEGGREQTTTSVAGDSRLMQQSNPVSFYRFLIMHTSFLLVFATDLDGLVLTSCAYHRFIALDVA
jgi:hypothetical protein